MGSTSSILSGTSEGSSSFGSSGSVGGEEGFLLEESERFSSDNQILLKVSNFFNLASISLSIGSDMS